MGRLSQRDAIQFSHKAAKQKNFGPFVDLLIPGNNNDLENADDQDFAGDDKSG